MPMRHREEDTLLSHFATGRQKVSSFDFHFRKISDVDCRLSHTVSLDAAVFLQDYCNTLPTSDIGLLSIMIVSVKTLKLTLLQQQYANPLLKTFRPFPSLQNNRLRTQAFGNLRKMVLKGFSSAELGALATLRCSTPGRSGRDEQHPIWMSYKASPRTSLKRPPGPCSKNSLPQRGRRICSSVLGRSGSVVRTELFSLPPACGLEVIDNRDRLFPCLCAWH